MDSSHHPKVISLSEKKDIICAVNPLRWKEAKLGNKTKNPGPKSYVPVGASSVSDGHARVLPGIYTTRDEKRAYRAVKTRGVEWS